MERQWKRKKRNHFKCMNNVVVVFFFSAASQLVPLTVGEAYNQLFRRKELRIDFLNEHNLND